MKPRKDLNIGKKRLTTVREARESLQSLSSIGSRKLTAFQHSLARGSSSLSIRKSHSIISSSQDQGFQQIQNRRSSSVQKQITKERMKVQSKKQESKGKEKSWVPTAFIRRLYRQKIVQYKQYLEKKKLLRKNGTFYDCTQKFKICADLDCSTFEHQDQLVRCALCGDYYHLFCWRPDTFKKMPQEEVYCHVCYEEHLEEIETLKSADDGFFKRRSRISCYMCHKHGSNLMNCSYCNRHFHKTCAEADKQWDTGIVFCVDCEKKVNEPSPKSIAEFYQTQSEPHTKGLMKVESQPTLFSQLLSSEEQSLTASELKLGVKTKNSHFKLPKKYSDTVAQEIRRNVYAALKAKRINFTDDQIYKRPYSDSRMNDVFLELPFIQRLSKTNEKIFQRFKERTRKGFFPNVSIINTVDMGMTVIANEVLPQMTLIAEYVGEVRTLRSAVLHPSDSIMDLLTTPFSVLSLLMIPDQHSNIARFLNGINNYNPKQKPNVRSAKIAINGRAHIVLFTCKKVKKGEFLVYNYNGGQEVKYPTQDFV